MDKLIIRNETDLAMQDILIMASKININNKDFNQIMATTFNGGYACITKRNKKSITLIFVKE